MPEDLRNRSKSEGSDWSIINYFAVVRSNVWGHVEALGVGVAAHKATDFLPTYFFDF